MRGACCCLVVVVVVGVVAIIAVADDGAAVVLMFVVSVAVGSVCVVLFFWVYQRIVFQAKVHPFSIFTTASAPRFTNMKNPSVHT